MISGKKVYRALLHLYPSEFRREYGESMAQTFDYMYRDHRPGFWPIMLGDLIASALHEHTDHFARRLLMERRTLIALIGGLLLASAVGWVDQHASEVQATSHAAHGPGRFPLPLHYAHLN